MSSCLLRQAYGIYLDQALVPKLPQLRPFFACFFVSRDGFLTVGGIPVLLNCPGPLLIHTRLPDSGQHCSPYAHIPAFSSTGKPVHMRWWYISRFCSNFSNSITKVPSSLEAGSAPRFSSSGILTIFSIPKYCLVLIVERRSSISEKC